jgi:hypothetical protein
MAERTTEQNISGLRCAAVWAIILGILCLEPLTFICMVSAGGAIVCCSGRDVPSIKKKMGCAKCCATCGLVFNGIGLIYMISIGAFLINLHPACETLVKDATFIAYDATIEAEYKNEMSTLTYANMYCGWDSLLQSTRRSRRLDDASDRTSSLMMLLAPPIAALKASGLSPHLAKHVRNYVPGLNGLHMPQLHWKTPKKAGVRDGHGPARNLLEDRNGSMPFEGASGDVMYPDCPCPAASIGNGWCDKIWPYDEPPEAAALNTCNISACGFDGGDCLSPPTKCPFFCDTFANDGMCDLMCNVDACYQCYDDIMNAITAEDDTETQLNNADKANDCPKNERFDCSCRNDDGIDCGGDANRVIIGGYCENVETRMEMACDVLTVIGIIVIVWPTLYLIFCIMALSYIIIRGSAIQRLPDGPTATMTGVEAIPVAVNK